MFLREMKRLLPNRLLPLPILRGPFRGAIIQLNPRCSLRKVFGLYEHELNGWLDQVLPSVSMVLDVGANDGYFTFGCAAAFRRLSKAAHIVAFEPIAQHFAELNLSLAKQPKDKVSFSLHNCFVGAEVNLRTTTLDQIAKDHSTPLPCAGALIKIDVEGAELEVIDGASCWLNRHNYFLIEVHEESFLERLKGQFASKGVMLRQINQRALPLIGREQRSPSNWWLVSDGFSLQPPPQNVHGK